ncbi:MAG: hypothetical protein JNL58_03035 [Planctomyces sp.]|nr:hypothetical protein [Planctomyces sp.]
MSRNTAVLVAVMCLIAVTSRVLPVFGLPNLSAMGAMMVFCGAVIRNPGFRFAIPAICLLGTDVLIHLKTGYAYDTSLPFVYLAYALIIGLGHMVRPTSWWSAALSGLGSSMIFFAVSNFGVWLLWKNTNGNYVYSHTFSGFVNCYEAAIPFIRGSLMGDVVFCVGFFGLASLMHVSAVAPSVSRTTLPHQL